MDAVAREWLISRNIIAEFLRELVPSLSRPEREHNAAAIIARLAQHEPPILTGFAQPDLAESHAGLLAVCEAILTHPNAAKLLYDHGLTVEVADLRDAVAKAKGI